MCTAGRRYGSDKMDERHEYAACEFLKWFTRKENNLRLYVNLHISRYAKDSNSVEALDEVIKDKGLKVNDKAYQCLDSILSSYDLTSFTHQSVLKMGMLPERY